MKNLGKTLRDLSLTGISQIIIQALGFACGIAIIRFLPSREYALYTMLNTMVSTMTLLTDGGISSGVMAQGGKVWHDRPLLGAVISTGLGMRKKLAYFSLAVFIPIVIGLMRHHDVTWSSCILLSLCMMSTFWTSLSASILQTAPKLHQDTSGLQKAQLSSSLLRLALTFTFVTLFPIAGIAILCAGISQAFGNWKIGKLSNLYADRHQSENDLVKKEIWKSLKRIMPGAIYYSIYGQISIWLISIFGSVETIAKVGALGRLAMLLNIIVSIFGILAIPRFARMASNSPNIVKSYFMIEFVLISLSALIVLVVWSFPRHSLMILGPQYNQMTEEVVLMTIGGVLGMVTGCLYNLNTCRAYLPPWYINPLVGTASLIGSIMIFDMKTVEGILLLNISTTSISMVLFTSVFIYYHNRSTQLTP